MLAGTLQSIFLKKSLIPLTKIMIKNNPRYLVLVSEISKSVILINNDIN